MEKRRLPHGNEEIGVLGIGLGGINNSSADEIETTIKKALDNGINFLDLCCGGFNVYEPLGKALKGRRDSVYLQLHFGAVYRKNGEYGWSRNLEEIKKTFAREMELLQTDYVDFGFLHCVDEIDDYEELINNGIFDFIKELKAKGVVRHIGLSSHSPKAANKVIDSGLIDMMMFSINPAYDLEQGDEYGIGSVKERADLFKRCESLGIGISVMKPFHGGQLLSASTSPFKVAMSKEQCIQYCLDRPSVLCVVPGIRNMADLDELLKYLSATPSEKDYSVIGQFTPKSAIGNCVYCNHCQPCPANIDIGLVNKYYDLSLAGDAIAHNHYSKLAIKADACIRCGHCESRCPFKVKQMDRMKEIATYFEN